MKVIKNVLLSSLIAITVSFNATANENIIEVAEINKELEASLSDAVSNIQFPTSEEVIAKQLEKARLELTIGQLVAQATNELPSGFKVVIAD